MLPLRPRHRNDHCRHRVHTALVRRVQLILILAVTLKPRTHQQLLHEEDQRRQLPRPVEFILDGDCCCDSSVRRGDLRNVDYQHVAFHRGDKRGVRHDRLINHHLHDLY